MVKRRGRQAAPLLFFVAYVKNVIVMVIDI